MWAEKMYTRNLMIKIFAEEFSWVDLLIELKKKYIS